MTAILYHFLAPEGGHLIWEENFIEKKQKQNVRSFSLSYTSKLNQQKQLDVVSKSAANIYQSDFFPPYVYYWPITQHLQLK